MARGCRARARRLNATRGGRRRRGVGVGAQRLQGVAGERIEQGAIDGHGAGQRGQSAGRWPG